jgi:predicted DNA-binding transcriptional regulator AlpA
MSKEILFYDLSELVSGKDKSGLLKVSASHLKKLVKSGDFPKPVRLGKKNLWRKGEVEKFIAEL